MQKGTNLSSDVHIQARRQQKQRASKCFTSVSSCKVTCIFCNDKTPSTWYKSCGVLERTVSCNYTEWKRACIWRWEEGPSMSGGPWEKRVPLPSNSVHLSKLGSNGRQLLKTDGTKELLHCRLLLPTSLPWSPWHLFEVVFWIKVHGAVWKKSCREKLCDCSVACAPGFHLQSVGREQTVFLRVASQQTLMWYQVQGS